MARNVSYTRINNNANGNPRLVVHHLELLTSEELDSSFLSWAGVKYDLALMRAKPMGGKKYHNKSYGGGIVFQEYEGCLDNTIERCFNSFEQSKVYTDAQNQIALVIVNDYASYTECLSAVRKGMQGIMQASHAFGAVFHQCQITADKIKKQFKIKVSAGAVWLAACMVCMELEETVNEEKKA